VTDNSNFDSKDWKRWSWAAQKGMAMGTLRFDLNLKDSKKSNSVVRSGKVTDMQKWCLRRG